MAEHGRDGTLHAPKAKAIDIPDTQALGVMDIGEG